MVFEFLLILLIFESSLLFELFHWTLGLLVLLILLILLALVLV